ncbi:hypothetical protein LCGC14_2736070, partial [marine sediment metagenome]
VVAALFLVATGGNFTRREIADHLGVTKSPALRAAEDALADLPEARCSAEAAASLSHGNPAQVLTSEAEFGDEAWASHQGRAVALGTYRAGMLHPSRVIVTGPRD